MVGLLGESVGLSVVATRLEKGCVVGQASGDWGGTPVSVLVGIPDKGLAVWGGSDCWIVFWGQLVGLALILFALVGPGVEVGEVPRRFSEATGVASLVPAVGIVDGVKLDPALPGALEAGLVLGLSTLAVGPTVDVRPVPGIAVLGASVESLTRIKVALLS